MKLETKIRDNFVGCFDEARGIALSKQKILKNKNSKCLSYFQRKLLNFIAIFILNLALSFFAYFNSIICPLVSLIFIIDITYLILALNRIYSSYKNIKSSNFISKITIDKEGITDTSYYGIKMTFSQDKILAIVSGKYTVTILTDTPYYFYFPISEKEKILKAFKRCNKNIDVI